MQDDQKTRRSAGSPIPPTVVNGAVTTREASGVTLALPLTPDGQCLPHALRTG